MAYTSIKAGTTGYTIQFPIKDSSSTTGAGLSGLVYNTASLVAYYKRDTDTAPTAITLATKTAGTWASGGFVTSGAGMTDKYELGVPNTAIAAGAKNVLISLSGAANMAPVDMLIELTATDNQDGNVGGMAHLTDARAFSSNASYQADWLVEMFNGASYNLPGNIDTLLWQISDLLKLGKNKVVTDPVTHKFTVYQDDDVTPLFTGLLYEDHDAQVPYRGQGASRRERLA